MEERNYHKHILEFYRPAGTSRGILKDKISWILQTRKEPQSHFHFGECSYLPGLSLDPFERIEEMLNAWRNGTLGEDNFQKELQGFPALRFALEMIDLSKRSEHPFILFESSFTMGENGIPINGLVWMGEKTFMKEQIVQKIESGFHVIKIKVGAIQFEDELALLKFIRSEFGKHDITIRLDANGAFKPKEAMDKLNKLSDFNIHSIEQPIRQGQIEKMAFLCEKSPIPIALDEELIGIDELANKQHLLNLVKPQYIILKPSLIGGLLASKEWIDLADNENIGWWMTSALESNIGLNAIAQYTAHLEVELEQGLGTGGLYSNNFESPLYIDSGYLKYRPETEWKIEY